jgi:hypothetical protein
MKVAPDGSVPWVETVSGNRYVASLANDSKGNILLTSWQATATPGPSILKLCANPSLTSCADGTLRWSKAFGGLGAFGTVAADPAGNVYASGIFGSGVDFGGGPRPTTGFPPFLVKYSPNGAYQWDTHAGISCAPSGCDFGSYVWGTNLDFDPAGNVVLATWGSPSIGGGIDFGFGPFPTYASTNIFLSAYQPSGAPCAGRSRSRACSRQRARHRARQHRRIIVSGAFGGSTLVDDVLLMTEVPEDPFRVDSFVASFGPPSPADFAAPIIGFAVDQTGASLSTVPRDIYVPATSADGAKVFFTPPTAIDEATPAPASSACRRRTRCSPSERPP